MFEEIKVIGNGDGNFVVKVKNEERVLTIVVQEGCVRSFAHCVEKDGTVRIVDDYKNRGASPSTLDVFEKPMRYWADKNDIDYNSISVLLFRIGKEMVNKFGGCSVEEALGVEGVNELNQTVRYWFE